MSRKDETPPPDDLGAAMNRVLARLDQAISNARPLPPSRPRLRLVVDNTKPRAGSSRS